MELLPGWTQHEDRTPNARWCVVIAAALAVQHEHFVVVVHLLRAEASRQLTFEDGVRCTDA
jgi:hypothetical protein